MFSKNVYLVMSTQEMWRWFFQCYFINIFMFALLFAVVRPFTIVSPATCWLRLRSESKSGIKSPSSPLGAIRRTVICGITLQIDQL